MNDLALKESIKDKVRRRDEQAKIITQIFELAKKVDSSLLYELSELVRFPQYSDTPSKKIQSRLDYTYWRELLDEFEVEKYMTSTDKEKFSDKLSDDTPVFSEESALSTLSGILSSEDALATNMIKKVYETVTNVSFKKGNNYEKRIQKGIPTTFRMRLVYVDKYGLPNYLSSSRSNIDLLTDLERALYLCANLTQPSRDSSIQSYIDKALVAGEMSVDSPLLQVTLYKNGNAKVTIKNEVALQFLNRWGRTGNRLE